MSTKSMVASSLSRQLLRFTSRITKSLSKPKKRAVVDVLFGSITSSSCLLSEMMRALCEATSPKKTIERLGRHLDDKRVADTAWRETLKEAGREINEETLILVDPTDLMKPYARKMEGLSTVRDGSTGEYKKGYHAIAACATELGSEEFTPLALELYSFEGRDKGMFSENTVILEVVREIMTATKGQGVLVLDRGGDRIKLIRPFLDEGLSFVIRSMGTRDLIYKGKKLRASEIARQMKCPTKSYTNWGGRRRPVSIGSEAVKIPSLRDYSLRLVVIRVDGLDQPMLLLTNLKGKGRKFRNRIYNTYKARWRVEEYIRFVKQTLKWEDIRVLKYQRLHTLTRLLCISAYFLAGRLRAEKKDTKTMEILLLVSRPIYRPEDRFLMAATPGLQRLWWSTGPPQAKKLAA